MVPAGRLCLSICWLMLAIIGRGASLARIFLEFHCLYDFRRPRIRGVVEYQLTRLTVSGPFTLCHHHRGRIPFAGSTNKEVLVSILLRLP